MYNKVIFRNNFLSVTIALVLSLFPVFHVGGDYWAETFVEYFDGIKGFENIFHVGWGGYYSFLPQLIAATQNTYLYEFIEPWHTARIASSTVIFVSVFLSFKAVLNFDSKLKWYLALLTFLMFLLQVSHPSVNSIISAGYFLYLPLIISMLIYSMSNEEVDNFLPVSKGLFILALLTKPSLIFISVFFGLRSSLFFKLSCLCVFLFQYYLTRTQGGALSVPLELNSDFIVLSLKSTLSIIGLIFNHLFLFDAAVDHSLYVGLSVLFLFVFFLFKFILELRSIFLLLFLLFGAIVPFLFLDLFLKDDLDLGILILSLAKAQYWIIISIVVPFAFFFIVYRVDNKLLTSVFLTLAISNLVYLNFHRIAESFSPNVTADSMIANQIPKDLYWRCFPVTPLPGFPIDELNGLFVGVQNKPIDVWRKGGCRFEMNFTHFGELGFNNSTSSINDMKYRGSYSYLIMMVSEARRRIALNKTQECYDVYGSSPVILDRIKGGSFDYITGWSYSESGVRDPNLLRSFLGKCFNLERDVRDVNAIVFYPDKK